MAVPYRAHFNDVPIPPLHLGAPMQPTRPPRFPLRESPSERHKDTAEISGHTTQRRRRRQFQVEGDHLLRLRLVHQAFPLRSPWPAPGAEGFRHLQSRRLRRSHRRSVDPVEPRPRPAVPLPPRPLRHRPTSRWTSATT
jgi:hypothetical protein